MLLWQGCGLIALLDQCEKYYYDTVIIKQQFMSTHLLWQKITQLQDKMWISNGWAMFILTGHYIGHK